MFENRQIALIEGECRRFRNSSKIVYRLTVPRIIKERLKISPIWFRNFSKMLHKEIWSRG